MASKNYTMADLILPPMNNAIMILENGTGT